MYIFNYLYIGYFYIIIIKKDKGEGHVNFNFFLLFANFKHGNQTYQTPPHPRVIHFTNRSSFIVLASWCISLSSKANYLKLFSLQPIPEHHPLLQTVAREAKSNTTEIIITLHAPIQTIFTTTGHFSTEQQPHAAWDQSPTTRFNLFESWQNAVFEFFLGLPKFQTQKLTKVCACMAILLLGPPSPFNDRLFSSGQTSTAKLLS